MKTIVRYEFNNAFFFFESPIPHHIKFIDPPHIPATGDAVHIRIEEFIDDPDVLDLLKTMQKVLSFSRND